jgi:hypothetical protein
MFDTRVLLVSVIPHCGKDFTLTDEQDSLAYSGDSCDYHNLCSYATLLHWILLLLSSVLLDDHASE